MSFRSSSSNTSFHHHHHHPSNDINNLNLDLLLELSSSSSNSSSSPSANYGVEPRVFSCNYCQRKFYSSQALGGHQNAHKLERTLAKKSRELSSMQNLGQFSDHRSNSSSFNIDGSSHLAGVGSLSQGQADSGVSYERREFNYGGSNPRSSGYAVSESNAQHQEDTGQLDLSLRL